MDDAIDPPPGFTSEDIHEVFEPPPGFEPFIPSKKDNIDLQDNLDDFDIPPGFEPLPDESENECFQIVRPTQPSPEEEILENQEPIVESPPQEPTEKEEYNPPPIEKIKEKKNYNENNRNNNNKNYNENNRNAYKAGNNKNNNRGRAGGRGGRTNYREKPQPRAKVDNIGDEPKPLPPKEDIIEVEDCLTCCEPIKYFGISQCNHRSICAMCLIKMRIFYKDYSCPQCKGKTDSLIITNNKELKYHQFDKHLMPFEKQCKAYFDDEEYYKVIGKLWLISCKVCDANFDTADELHAHLEKAHQKYYCKICFKFRKVFLHEQLLFSKHDLFEHLRKGDEKLRIRPHPSCRHCNGKKFYDEDALYKHCMQIHETCWICDQNGNLYQFYKNYPELEGHFRSKHFICEDLKCLSEKFVVFASKAELQTHSLDKHMYTLTKEEQNKARVLEVSFTVAPRRERFEDTSSNQPQKQQKLSNKVEPLPLFKIPETTEERKKRNTDLKEKITEHLKGNKPAIESLSRASNQYRKGELSTSQFYQNSFSILGGLNDKTLPIFVELVSLLPDKNKQQELREEHLKSGTKETMFPSLAPVPSNNTIISPNSSENVYRQARNVNAPITNSAFPPLSTGPSRNAWIPQNSVWGRPNNNQTNTNSAYRDLSTRPATNNNTNTNTNKQKNNKQNNKQKKTIMSW